MTNVLQMLTVEELTAACAAVKAACPGDEPDLRYPVVAVAEPGHEARRGGDALKRQAEVVAIDRKTGALHEVLVDTDSGAIASWNTVHGAIPALLFEEAANAIGAVMGDQRWVDALASRGITDIGSVQIDPWPAGNFGIPGEEGRRLVRCVSYIRHELIDNGYAHPIDGVVAVVDTATNEVIDVTDSGPVPLPATCGRYGVGDVGPLREGIHPLEITQAEGPSFLLDGQTIDWLGWHLQFTVHPIEGLVLHDITYKDRPILTRAGISEMVVPYGAAGPNHWWKNAFDVGEWGLGRMIQSLSLGCDCLGEIRYADAVLPDESGGARVVSNAVCMHEEDYGILWKHVDMWTGSDEVRRSRRFVISSVSTVGNYEYGFFWYLYLDGTIQLEVKLTGIMQTGACDPAATSAPDRGVLIAPGLWAPNHQHLFCARLDFCVDGPANTVEEIDVVGAEPGPGNEHGNAIVEEATVLDRESKAQRLADTARNRRWLVVNRGVTNETGGHPGYALLPQSAVTMLAHPTSSVAKRAAFATRNVWVTPYTPGERRPAGEYPNQSRGGDGLPAWTAADRPIEDRELVVWHSFGVTHLPRPEDWPVMPVEYAGFLLKPVGFFPRNPALDVPPSHSDHCAG